MGDKRMTNWLLAGILVALSIQLWTRLGQPVQAETFRLDLCITEQMSDTPQQYLHVIAHPPQSSR